MVIRIVDRASNADLDNGIGIEQLFFDSAPKRRSVRVGIVAEIGIVGVRVRVEMDHGDRPLLRDGAKRGQRGQVVAARDERLRPMHHDRVDVLLNALERISEIDRVDGDVADVGFEFRGDRGGRPRDSSFRRPKGFQ